MSPQNCREFVAGVGRTTQATLRLLLLLGATFLSWGGVPPPDCRAEDGPAGESSPWDRLDPARIPPEERFDWQPKELVAVLGSHRGRHWGEVTAVAFSPDGKQVASAGEDRVVRRWNAETLRAATILRGHEGGVFAIAYSPDGTTLASASADRTVRLWDLTGLEPKVTQVLNGHQGDICSVAFSRDGKALASGDWRGNVLLWDLTNAQALLRAELPPQTPPAELLLEYHGRYKNQAVAFSPDGTMLATSSLLDVVLWDLKSLPPKVIRTLKPRTAKLSRGDNNYPSVVQSLAFSPDGKTLAAGHYDGGGTLLWDMTGDLQQETAWLQGGTTRTVAFSPNGKMLVSVGSSGGLLWEVSGKTSKLRSKFAGSGGAAFSPDGKTFVSGDWNSVRLWDLTGPEPKAKLPVRGHDDEVRAVIISPDGRTLATSSHDGTLRLWDLGGPQPKSRAPFHVDSEYATSLTFTPDGKKLISGNSNGTLQVWDVSAGQPRLLKKLGESKSQGERDENWGLAISPDGKTAATSGRFHSLRLWDLTPEGSSDPIEPSGPRRYHGALAYSPDGKTVASGNSDNGTLRLWNVADPKSPQLQFVLDAHEQARSRRGTVHAVAFAPDGRVLVSGGDDGVVRFWNLSDEKPTERSTLRLDGPVSSVNFSPDGSKLVVAFGSGYIFLGDSSGKKLHEWQLEGPSVVRFAPDGRHLVIENNNATAYILRLPR